MNTTMENTILYVPKLETQVSAEIDWSSWPYCLVFPPSELEIPQLETQVSAEIDWSSWPYCLSFLDDDDDEPLSKL